MNHAYRIVFNRSLGLLQAVAETARARGKGGGGAALGLGLALAVGSAGAQTLIWAEPGTGDWDVITNWSPSLTPTSSDIVRIRNGGTAVINVGNAEAGLLTLGSELGTSGHLRIDTGGRLDVYTGLHIGNALAGGATLDINGGHLVQHGGPSNLLSSSEITLRNNGTLDLRNNGNGGALNLVGSTFTLGEGGRHASRQLSCGHRKQPTDLRQRHRHRYRLHRHPRQYVRHPQRNEHHRSDR